MAHPNKTKAQAISALILGMGVNEVASKYKLPHQTVSRWNTGIVAEETGESGPYKKERFAALVGDALTSQLQAMKKIADVAQDEDYIRRQSANDLGILFGVIADKSIHILGAAERAEERAAQRLLESGAGEDRAGLARVA